MSVVSVIMTCVSLSWAGSTRRSAPRLVALLERYVLELSVGVVGFFGLRHFRELHLLESMGSYGAVLGPVTLASLLSDYHRLVPLADEIVGVEFLIWGEAPVQARLEEVPGLGANLHAVFDAPVRVVDELETLVLALGDAVPHSSCGPYSFTGFACVTSSTYRLGGRSSYP